MKRWIYLALVCVLMVTLLVSCGKAQEETETVPVEEESSVQSAEVSSAEESSAAEPAPVVAPAPTYYYPLTGLPSDTDVSASRPYAIMINDISVALPQHGVSHADIIYEMQVEGGITRMMAVFHDFADTPVVGSIRSSRPYYLDLAQALDAIYVHAGGSDEAYSLMSSRGIDHIDGLSAGGGVFYRDAARRASMGYEHSLMIDTAALTAYVADKGIRSEHEAGYSWNMAFADTGSAAGGTAAAKVDVAFSGNKETIFDYDSANKVYAVSQYGSAYMDGENDTAVTVKNVIVLYAPFSLISGDAKGRLSSDLTGSGTGYYIADGKYVALNWTRADTSSQFVYSLANGADVTFARGTSYICIVPKSSTVDFS